MKKSSLFACDSNVYVDRYDRNAGRFEDLCYLYQPESHQSSALHRSKSVSYNVIQGQRMIGLGSDKKDCIVHKGR